MSRRRELGVYNSFTVGQIALIVIAAAAIGLFTLSFLSQAVGASWSLYRSLWVRTALGFLGPIEYGVLIYLIVLTRRSSRIDKTTAVLSVFLFSMLIVNLWIAIEVGGVPIY